jgi:hypothetical protein
MHLHTVMVSTRGAAFCKLIGFDVAEEILPGAFMCMGG